MDLATDETSKHLEMLLRVIKILTTFIILLR